MTEEAPARRPQRRRVLLLSGLGGLAVAVLAVLGWGMAQRTDPRDLVVDYLDAIAAGDVEAANALATDGVWTGAGLPAAGSMDDAGTITAVQVDEDGRITSYGGSAGRFEALDYAVSYEVGGEPVSESVFVERTGGWWLWEEWRIRLTLAQPARLLLEQPVQEVDVAIGSTAATVRAGWSVTEVPLYPATYRVVPDQDAVVELDPQQLAVTDEPGYVQLAASPEQLRAAADPELVAAATGALTACLQRSGQELWCEGGARTDVGVEDAPVSWRVEGEVEVAQEQRVTQNWDTSVVVVASWTDADGTLREERVRLLGGVVLLELGPDDARVVADWDRATTA